tara:strand:+ start:3736 stop:4731 length:996 start_codon:yes stop_codon:yes gene_type:complete
MTNRHIVDRALPERTNLKFYFPMPTPGDNYYVVELPFFENVQISESKKARYQKYSLISRSSNLYSYLGADSRTLNVQFSLTLPHLLEEHPDINIDKYISYLTDKDNVENEKKKFKEPYAVESTPQGMAFKLGTSYTRELAQDSANQVLISLESTTSGMFNAYEKAYLGARYGLQDKALQQNVNSLSQQNFITRFAAATVSNQQFVENNQSNQLKHRIIDLIIYWTNIIRSSVVNYSKNPMYGPPIIRLNHGIMYQNIPCICTDYSIQYEEQAGYDLDTLLPRKIKVNLKLEETRTGDFGEFDPKGDMITRDNLAGWEAVVLGETNSMDPGY